MVSIIQENILSQGFEQVLNRIGEILIVEWSAQKIKQSLPEDVNFFKERILPINQSEDLYINLLYSGSDTMQKGQKDGMYRTIYFIDVYTTGENRDDKSGSEDSSDRLLRYMGIIRYILSYSDYKTLLFEEGLIGGTYIDSMTTLDPTFLGDASFSRMGRITFSVKILENQTLWQGTALQQNLTGVSLGTTNKGYKFIYNAT